MAFMRSPVRSRSGPPTLYHSGSTGVAAGTRLQIVAVPLLGAPSEPGCFVISRSPVQVGSPAPNFHTFPARSPHVPARAIQLRANLRANHWTSIAAASGCLCFYEDDSCPLGLAAICSRSLPIQRFVHVSRPRQATPRMLAR